MSLMRRLAMLFRAKANKALDRAEDPREVLDYSYERQLELLVQVRRGVADVATSRGASSFSSPSCSSRQPSYRARRSRRSPRVARIWLARR